MDNNLREKMILMMLSKMLDHDLENMIGGRSFSVFLRANPVLLVDAMLSGKQLTGEDIIEVCGSYGANPNSTSSK